MSNATEAMRELMQLGEYFWAGEAEIATNFLTASHDPMDHVHWLRHQCYRELRGPGLLKRPHSRTQSVIDNVNAGLPMAETREGRAELEYQLEQIREEFTHFRLYADILEDITAEPVLMSDLEGLELPSDRRIEEMRTRLIAEDADLARLAYSFAEGGGAGIFYAASVLETDDPLLLRIKEAGRVIYDDEVGHGQHNFQEVEDTTSDPAEFAKLRVMLLEVCKDRLRMRAEMFGNTMSEERIQEITEGKIEPMVPVTVS
jgi:hypothetical protein